MSTAATKSRKILEHRPVASSSSLPNTRPYSLIVKEMSGGSDTIGDIPLARRPHQNAIRQAYRPGARSNTQPEVVQKQNQQQSQLLFLANTQNPETTLTRTNQLTKKKEVEQKGRLVLKNRDVIKNGGLPIADTTEEMEKGLALLSPVLTSIHHYFLINDQQEWSRRKASSKSKIDNSSASLQVYGGAPPPEELTMHMSLFIKYVHNGSWWTLEECLKGHCLVVMELRENYERRYPTNPCAPGGPHKHLNPLTGEPQPESSGTKKAARCTNYPKNI
ncbi:hypothetical protein DFH28DRAFT_1083716 [Melampsora americana]|nr:hypothetical protein DFH28DRAFT_1083716 [Melampsora americana]